MQTPSHTQLPLPMLSVFISSYWKIDHKILISPPSPLIDSLRIFKSHNPFLFGPNVLSGVNGLGTRLDIFLKLLLHSITQAGPLPVPIVHHSPPAFSSDSNLL